MTMLIVLCVVVAIVATLNSCLFNNHKYVVVQRDDVNDCHKLKCSVCGKEVVSDPYTGITG